MKLHKSALLAAVLIVFCAYTNAEAQRFSHTTAARRTVVGPRGGAVSTTVVSHDAAYRYPRPVPVPVPRPVPVPVRPVPVRPVPVPVPVPVPAFHHPYYWHPYTPYYWGPAWHPIGFMIATLTTAAIIVSVHDRQYHYDSGVYYVQVSDGYKVVPAPVGATITVLPDGYSTLTVSGASFYYYGGAFYSKSGSSYTVVKAPAGAVITNLPDGAKEETVSGQKYMVYDNTYYEPITQNGHDSYIVTEVK